MRIIDVTNIKTAEDAKLVVLQQLNFFYEEDLLGVTLSIAEEVECAKEILRAANTLTKKQTELLKAVK